MGRRSKMARKDCTITRVAHSGMIIVSAVVNGQVCKMRYMGYSKRDSVSRFIKDMSQLGEDQ